ncbi:hypothetical protein XA68_13018 [Ophiocordyceps unilateralis]|uniref:Uncharacterized protein n=1 Tax=Ophiocordyceps unilateralis TaxID=268505 RepID=A0A2A9PDF7_OPHUN|nr:hypothetical protein XA68_13018 [Ophiocordyceps unilateralis]
MRFPRAALSLTFLHFVRGDDWQIRECITYKDSEMRDLLPQFLKNASSCISGNRGRDTMICTTYLMPEEKRPVFHPLIEIITSWERYFSQDLNSAFLHHGDFEPYDWPAKMTVYDRLLDVWETTGQLCFYKHIPSLADRIHPQEAGLLTLFYQTEDIRPRDVRPGPGERETQRNLRSPSLKMGGTRWEYDGSLACAAGSAEERQHQIRAVEEMIRRAGQEWHSDLISRQFGSHYLINFSTDSFLQGVITGWRDEYVCPSGLRCHSTPKSGKAYLPANVKSYLGQLRLLLRAGKKVCIVFKGTHLEPYRYYVVAPRPEVQ